MTAGDIERDLKRYCKGASFITPGELSKYLGEKNTSRVRNRFMTDAFRIEGTNKYFIPEIATKIYQTGATS